MMVWPAIISAVGGLAGGALGALGRGKKVSSGDNLKSTVTHARQLGIHPLAALGSVTTPSFGTSNNLLGDAVGSAISEIGRGLGRRSEEARLARAEDRAERLAQAEIAERNASARSMLMDSVSRSVIANARRSATGGAPMLHALNDAAKGRQMETVVGPFKVGPGTRAEDFEQEYGEGSEIYSFMRMLRDAFNADTARIRRGDTPAGRYSRAKERARVQSRGTRGGSGW